MESFFSTPALFLNLSFHKRPPEGVTRRYSPFSSVSLYGLSSGLALRNAISVRAILGAFHFRYSQKVPTQAPKTARM
ncbi:hypothetical protein Astex_1476 [Asticcacaulis excentricus CB 48]|uniref:Uncharacterized protein n=1 Tax=Asticcacaulis excentricus (strain ATCC 15261 / DSM 4724 / KCTC 12464 / NCIMB 9791 / VKM B-1370 / CB 48) TaxID=573065 RepID=E8RPW9_ASTEC|nr:hypothetical protein Astex_1476 [Asticcacaulis excentricus CB 48]